MDVGDTGQTAWAMSEEPYRRGINNRPDLMYFCVLAATYRAMFTLWWSDHCTTGRLCGPADLRSLVVLHGRTLMESDVPYTMSRPRQVTIATYLLYAVPAAGLVGSLIDLAFVDDLKRAAERAYAGTDMAATAAADTATSALTGLVAGIVSAILIGALVFFCGMGKNWARIIVWVFTGGQLVTLANEVLLYSQGYFARKPSWYLPRTVATLTIDLVVLCAASILLALPASRPYFRKSLSSAAPAASEAANA